MLIAMFRDDRRSDCDASPCGARSSRRNALLGPQMLLKDATSWWSRWGNARHDPADVVTDGRTGRCGEDGKEDAVKTPCAQPSMARRRDHVR